jgi:hypothetical protein
MHACLPLSAASSRRLPAAPSIFRFLAGLLSLSVFEVVPVFFFFFLSFAYGLPACPLFFCFRVHFPSACQIVNNIFQIFCEA